MGDPLLKSFLPIRQSGVGRIEPGPPTSEVNGLTTELKVIRKALPHPSLLALLARNGLGA